MSKDNDDTRGYLITFEGSEGSGKTTQASRMAERFEAHGYEVVVTREPGGTQIGEEIRHILMHSASGENMRPETELLLFAASRAQLVREVIAPALAEGKIVLCDRFLDSTTVYQGVGRKIAAEPVHMINTFAVGDLMPDVTVVVDVPAELGFERIRHRVRELPDRMEQENIEFYRKVRTGYLMLAKALSERFIIADGTQPVDVVADHIWGELRKRVI
jgi:dTMP kinase